MTTNVPQDVIELAKQAGFDVDDDGDIWGSENGSLLRFAELLRAQRLQCAEPVAAWRIKDKHDHHTGLYQPICGDVPNWTKEEPARYEITPLYTTPPQANALVAAAYRKAAEIAHGQYQRNKPMQDAGGQDDSDNYVTGYKEGCSDVFHEILASIPADAEAALRERDRALCQRLLKVVEEHYELIAPLDIDGSIVNSVLGEGGK
jgi:hypothetical protein